MREAPTTWTENRTPAAARGLAIRLEVVDPGRALWQRRAGWRGLARAAGHTEGRNGPRGPRLGPTGADYAKIRDDGDCRLTPLPGPRLMGPGPGLGSPWPCLGRHPGQPGLHKGRGRPRAAGPGTPPYRCIDIAVEREYVSDSDEPRTLCTTLGREQQRERRPAGGRCAGLSLLVGPSGWGPGRRPAAVLEQVQCPRAPAVACPSCPSCSPSA